MKQLGNTVIQTTRSGSYQYAKVESFNRALVTVRLGTNGTGARLTNLNVVGTPSVGDVVIVDYSTNVPYVRTLASIYENQNPLAIAPTPLELPSTSSILDPCSLAYGECCGMIASVGGLGFGVPGYSTGGCGLAAASAASIDTAKVIAIGGPSGTALFHGFINTGGGFGPGYIFLAVGGGVTQTKPTGTDECVVVLGTGLTSNIMYFNPSLVAVELL